MFPTTNDFDRKTIPIVHLIRDIIQPLDILLFGSRARGGWSETSDINICAIQSDAAVKPEKRRQAKTNSEAKAREIYGQPVQIYLTRYTPAEFRQNRDSEGHLAHAVTREGISMILNRDDYARTLTSQSQVRPRYSWNDVQRRFMAAQRQIQDAEQCRQRGLDHSEIGIHLRQSMEHALKGLIAYLEYYDSSQQKWEYWQNKKDPGELQDLIKDHSPGREIVADYDLSILNRYATGTRRAPAENPIPEEWQTLELVKEAVARMIEFIETDNGNDMAKTEQMLAQYTWTENPGQSDRISRIR